MAEFERRSGPVLPEEKITVSGLNKSLGGDYPQGFFKSYSKEADGCLESRYLS
jgi:hypothetical protein